VTSPATRDAFLDKAIGIITAPSPKQATDMLGPSLSLERLITGTDMGAFAPSAPQLALIRALEGKPIGGLLTPEEMTFHFGVDAFPPRKPRVVYLRTGVRAGKSLISAMGGLLWSSLVCDMSGVRKGELVRAPIVSARLDTTGAAFSHLVGSMTESDLLRTLLVDEPGAESFTLRRPDGYLVKVVLLAASPGGTNLRSTWLSGCVLDEADFFDGDGKQANLGDQVKAATTRLLPGAQLYMPSSPWSREGYFYINFEAAFGKPGREFSFHSDTCSMNTSPEMAATVEAERAKDPHTAEREYDAIPLDINSSAFFPETALDIAVVRGRQLLPPNGAEHAAGVDLGFRKNSSALALARVEGGKVQLAHYEELVPLPGKPLVPSAVIGQFASTCRSFRARAMRGDMHYVDMAHDELAKWRKAHSYEVVYDEVQPTAAFKAEEFTIVRRLAAEGLLELPDDPRLLNQFRGAKSRAGPGGVIQIQLPKAGQAHGDILMAAVLAIARAAKKLNRAPGAPPKLQTYRSQTD
jgi:hypothetical protein